jgi:hypothetical protein
LGEGDRKKPAWSKYSKRPPWSAGFSEKWRPCSRFNDDDEDASLYWYWHAHEVSLSLFPGDFLLLLRSCTPELATNLEERIL